MNQTLFELLILSRPQFLRIKILSFIIFLLHLVSLIADVAQPHHTTAFIGCPGQTDILPSYSHYSTKSFWNKKGANRPAYNHFKRNSYQLYVEHAIHKRISLLLNSGYSLVKETLQKDGRAFEDFQIGGKFLFSNWQTSALTGQFIAIIPAGTPKSSIRYGKWGAQAGLLFSKAFTRFNRAFWIDSGIAYRFYRDFPSDQIRTFLSLGCKAFSKVVFLGTLELEYGLYNGRSRHNKNTIAWNPKYRLLKGQIEAWIPIHTYFTITVGVFQHLWGSQVGRGGGFFGGSWITF